MALERMDVSPATAKIILARTAGTRHRIRVRDAAQAAREGAKAMKFVSGNRPDEEETEVLAVALCLLDQFGLGGHMGLDGAGTTRIPQFEALGKGRKQAHDGPAWTAAIEQAGAEMFRRIKKSASESSLWGGADAFILAPVFPEGGAPSDDWTGLGVLVDDGEILPLRGVELRPWTEVVVTHAAIRVALKELLDSREEGAMAYAPKVGDREWPCIDGWPVRLAGSPEDWSIVRDTLEAAQVGEDIDAELEVFGDEIPG